MKTVGDFIFGESEVSNATYVINWVVLLVLLLITWRLAYAHLGRINLAIAMIVAVVKCAFVIWSYMDLRASPKLVLMLFGMALVMLFIAVLLTMTDYLTRGELEGDRNYRVGGVPTDIARPVRETIS